MSAPSHRFIWFDFIRGLSAIAVCASHLRAVMFIDHSKLASSGTFEKIFYVATGLGHQAVLVFFVLSGFFVGRSVLRAGENFRIGSYALARLSRLWIVLVPALILTAVVDHVIGILAPGALTGAFQQVWSSGPVSSDEYSDSALNFFANLLFLQTIATPVFGTNGPLWSLANEFWYYVMFPLCLLAFGFIGSTRYGGQPVWRLAFGVLAVGLLLVLPSAITSAYPVWLLGLVIHFLIDRLDVTTRRIALGAGIALFIAALAYSKMTDLHSQLGIPPGLLIGIGFCVLCVALANMPQPRNPKSAFVQASHAISSISYSLYLVHFPFVVLIGATLYGSQRMAPNAVGLAQFAGWMVVLMLVSAGFWWLFERRTEVFRNAVIPALQGTRV